MADSSVPLYNTNDGLTGRDGGPYLDQEEMRIAEERRAKVEGRKPDYDNPGPTAGIQLRTAAEIIHHGVHNVIIPSQTNNQRTFDVVVDAAAKDKETPFGPVDKINKSEVDRLVKEDEKRQNAQDENSAPENTPDEDDTSFLDGDTGSKTSSSSSRSTSKTANK